MAALKIQFTLTASQTLDVILGFIAQENADAASKLAKRIEHGIHRLASFPDSGRKIPEAPEHRERELVVPPSVRIFCRVDGGTLWVLYAMRSEQAFDIEMLVDDQSD
jgi:plasmid stabilization system protein ParE